MAKAIIKSDSINELLLALTGRDRVTSITNDVCASCGGSAASFRDALSEREFSISGLCQSCQDVVWGEG